ncbi:MAG: integral membrane [Planctomycetota bacterium]|nr:MAG: integral membrane [Planctomycetota bacterium]
MEPQTLSPTAGLKQPAFGETARRDLWWVQPVAVFFGLSAALAYLNWAAFQNAHYVFGNYLSPLYSPEVFGESPHAWFGPKPGWWPAWMPFSPAFLILWAPAGFRMTCYYYRGAYYKSFWADPPACGVGEPRKSYWGERSLPLILQNSHRFFLYCALLFLVFLSQDVWKALWFEDPVSHKTTFGIGVGTLVLALNLVLLSGYTLGCHSFRHLVGGNLDCLSCAPARLGAYRCSSFFNSRHMLWAWISLVGVTFADVYVRLCSMGVWTDWRII